MDEKYPLGIKSVKLYKLWSNLIIKPRFLPKNVFYAFNVLVLGFFLYFLLQHSIRTYQTTRGWKTPLYPQIGHWVIFTQKWLIVHVVQTGRGDAGRSSAKSVTFPISLFLFVYTGSCLFLFANACYK